MKEENKKSIEEMMSEISEHEEKDTGISQEKRTKNLLVISVAAVLILITIALAYVFLTGDQTTSSRVGQNVKIINNAKGNAIEEENSTAVASSEKDIITEEEPEVDPLKTKQSLEGWEKVERDKLSPSLKEAMLEEVKKGFIGDNFLAMPSAKEGFTSDPSKMVDEDGVPNIYYVDLTQEEFIEQYTDILYRIANPIYGKWVKYQMTNKVINQEDAYKEVFRGVATGDYLSSIRNSKKNPLKMNVDGNDYRIYDENQKDSNGARIVGRPIDGTVNYKDARNLESVVTIEYTLPDGSTFEEDIKLELTIINNKLLINGMELSE